MSGKHSRDYGYLVAFFKDDDINSYCTTDTYVRLTHKKIADKSFLTSNTYDSADGRSYVYTEQDVDNFEGQHQFIQCMFPTLNSSGAQSDTPYLHKEGNESSLGTPQDVQALMKDVPGIQSKMIQSFKVVMEIYGLEVDDEDNVIVKPKEGTPLHKCLTTGSYDHNLSRIARILESMQLFGLEKYSHALLHCIKTNSSINVPKSSISIYEKTISTYPMYEHHKNTNLNEKQQEPKVRNDSDSPIKYGRDAFNNTSDNEPSYQAFNEYLSQHKDLNATQTIPFYNKGNSQYVLANYDDSSNSDLPIDEYLTAFQSIGGRVNQDLTNTFRNSTVKCSERLFHFGKLAGLDSGNIVPTKNGGTIITQNIRSLLTNESTRSAHTSVNGFFKSRQAGGQIKDEYISQYHQNRDGLKSMCAALAVKLKHDPKYLDVIQAANKGDTFIETAFRDSVWGIKSSQNSGSQHFARGHTNDGDNQLGLLHTIIAALYRDQLIDKNSSAESIAGLVFNAFEKCCQPQIDEHNKTITKTFSYAKFHKDLNTFTENTKLKQKPTQTRNNTKKSHKNEKKAIARNFDELIDILLTAIIGDNRKRDSKNALTDLLKSYKDYIWKDKSNNKVDIEIMLAKYIINNATHPDKTNILIESVKTALPNKKEDILVRAVYGLAIDKASKQDAMKYLVKKLYENGNKDDIARCQVIVRAKLKSNEKALGRFNKIEKDVSNSLLFAIANKEAEQGKYTNAISTLKAISIETTAYCMVLSHCYTKEGKFDDAINVITKYKQQHSYKNAPNHRKSDICLQLARIYAQKKDYMKAEKAATEAISFDQNNNDAKKVKAIISNELHASLNSHKVDQKAIKSGTKDILHQIDPQPKKRGEPKKSKRDHSEERKDEHKKEHKKEHKPAEIREDRKRSSHKRPKKLTINTTHR